MCKLHCIVIGGGKPTVSGFYIVPPPHLYTKLKVSHFEFTSSAYDCSKHFLSEEALVLSIVTFS